jgi:bla regulator protein BlaR1
MISGLVNHLWQSTLFCAAVWLITLALRQNGAALRHSLWLIASIKFLVPFSLLYQLGVLLGLPPTLGTRSLLFSQAIEITTPMVSPTQSLILLSPMPAPSWSIVLATLWAIGAAIVGRRWWVGWRAADSMARAARPVPGSPPDTRITDAAIEPAVARVFRPVVLLPAALLGRLTGPQLDAVLAHEREHIARRDNLVSHVHRLVETMFWFHPMVWWIGHQLVAERERACDEAVLHDGHQPEDYAEGILAVCRHCHHAQLNAVASAVSGNLPHRIREIIRNCGPARPGIGLTVVLAVAALSIAAGPLFAGAVDGAVRRSQRIASDTLAFRSAEIFVSPSRAVESRRSALLTESRTIVVRNTSLRELVALTYGVSAADVKGGGDWLDSPRYDIRAELRDPLASPEDFEPMALRGAVIELLAARFDLQVHINQHCQSPCGRRALLAPPSSP